MIDVLKSLPPGQYWYLASPYTHYPAGRTEAWTEVCAVAAKLMANGIDLFCPIAHGHAIERNRTCHLPPEHEFWMARNLPMMQHAHGIIVALMHTWVASRGVRAEMEYFAERHRPIAYYNPTTQGVFLLERDGVDQA
jgi:hypothetical protein